MLLFTMFVTKAQILHRLKVNTVSDYTFDTITLLATRANEMFF